MAFITFEQIRRRAATLNEGRIKLAKSLTEEKNLFLSHSHLDSNSVYGAMALLEDNGAEVYVDLADMALATMNMPQKCQRVKDAIYQCGRLVVLFTENAKTSRWIPWELGLADGLHSNGRVATLPIGPSSEEQEWGKQEYFGLYPQIRYLRLQGRSAPDYVVFNPETRLYWTLAQWLQEP